MARMKELAAGIRQMPAPDPNTRVNMPPPAEYRLPGRHLPAYPCRVADCDALMLFGHRGACDAHPRGHGAILTDGPDDDGLVTVPYRNTTERSTTK